MRLVTAICTLFSLLSWAQETDYKLDLITTYSNAQKELDAGRIDNAYSQFKTCLKKDSSCVEAYLSLSSIDFERGAYKTSHFYAALGHQKNPLSPRTNLQLGKTFYALHNFNAAYPLLKKAVLLHQKSVENVYYLALCSQQLGMYEDALHYFQYALDLSPENDKIWNSRGLLFMETEQYETAKNDFLFAHKLNPDLFAYRTNLIQAFFFTDEYQKAFDLSNESMPNANLAEKSQLYTLQGYYYLNTKNNNAADSCFTIAVNLDNNQASPFVGLAVVNIENENFKAAVENCNAAIALQPEISSAYLNRGIANEMLRKTDQACIDWEKAFFLGSQKAITYLNDNVCDD